MYRRIGRPGLIFGRIISAGFGRIFSIRSYTRRHEPKKKPLALQILEDHVVLNLGMGYDVELVLMIFPMKATPT